MTHGDGLKRGADRNMSLLDHLKLMLEHSHNAYTFRYQCKGLNIIIEKILDGSIVASYSNDQDGHVTIDVTQAPFDKLLKYS
jgi:hypothetical protein